MNNLFTTYIQSVSNKFQHKETSEMGYRTDFEILFKGVFESINVKRIDHDARAKQGNKPDFVVLKNDIPILYIEAKDIGVSLDKIEKSDQMARYFGYSNLILTDYLEFRFYRNGIRYEEPVKIAEFDLKNRSITPIISNYEKAFTTIIDFTTSYKEPIKKGEHLARIMGGKGQRIRDNVVELFQIRNKDDEIIKVYETIKKLLIHDLSPEAFADMYAQTLVYGLFVARYYDDTPENFSRREAQELIPASNPFLGHFFDHIAGRNFEKRLSFIVDELCEVFSHSDVKALMTQYFKLDLFGNKNEGPDPVIHFYEDFLKEYDPELRKRMGAYYTPLSVVNFIVSSVDQILKKDFGLAQGLGDTTKLTNGKHKVQILDPAVGTGTFLSATIDKIHEDFEKQKQGGRWAAYVHHDLLSRLHGFEIMMSPYTIAHLKISLKLQETGFKYFNETRDGKTRLGVYLTNSLEDTGRQQNLLAFDFGAAIAEEAKKAGVIKNETPVMVVLGNPPYSGVSSNETAYANNLVEKYKVEPGGKQKLQERKHWLNDDYVKFIAFAESMIDKNGEGVLAMITNHGYIDNPTFRGMRWHLRNTFDDIYILDLHGNSNKKETTPDGKKDENIFNIKTGVSIILGVKKSNVKKKKLAQIHKVDFYGLCKEKFEMLDNSNIKNINWVVLPEEIDSWIPEGERKTEYQKGFSITELFPKNTTGIVTMGDNFIIDEDKDVLVKRVNDFLQNDISESELKNKYNLGKNYAKWVIENKNNIQSDASKIVPLAYRPFDMRYTYFDNKLVWRTRTDTMQHFVGKDNIGILFSRMTKGKSFAHTFVTKNISETIYLSPITGTNAFNAPLYLYSEDGSKIPNLKKEIVDDIEKIVGKVSPENILDYIYAVLHSPSYREKYKEFLKIDFPRVLYPKDKKQFEVFVAFGKELRELHLLESPKVNKLITTYPVAGTDIVEKISYKDEKVFINKEQYFGNVPEIAWNFYIGGYQPAQKWLKDRKGRTLTNTDIEHYQKIIVVLVETDRVMKEIDKIQ